MKKIIVMMGTRPEVIKLAPVVQELSKIDHFDVHVCATAQHRQMMDQMLDIFGIAPQFDFDLMTPGQDLTDVTCGVLQKCRDLFLAEKPDVIFVQGDTTTAFAASLAAFYLKIPVAHVEAGLRTRDRYFPWPEELNRRLIGNLATYHFTPTEWSRQNLLAEHVPSEDIHVTGNTVVDAVMKTSAYIESTPDILAQCEAAFSQIDSSKRIVLVTSHRRESFGEGTQNICRAIKQVSELPNVEVAFPVHLNPNVRAPVNAILGEVSNVHLMEPLDYFQFIYIMRRCALLLTDSGGLQEEGPVFDKPVLVMRKETERPEGLEAGTSCIVGVDADTIYERTKHLLEDADAYQKMAKAKNPFGDGTAGQKIAEIMTHVYQSKVKAAALLDV